MSENESAKKIVLVVEDEVSLLEAIKIKVESMGLGFIGTRTIDEALDVLESFQQVDAIWLDHYLIGSGDGLDFMTNVRAADSKWKHTPVFVITNTAGPEKIAAYQKLGVTKYFVKSEHRLDEIINEIKKTLEV